MGRYLFKVAVYRVWWVLDPASTWLLCVRINGFIFGNDIACLSFLLSLYFTVIRFENKK